MESNESDILTSPVKNIFEVLFRKNVVSVILLVILANGYSNIPGMNDLLTYIFSSHILRTVITFILFSEHFSMNCKTLTTFRPILLISETKIFSTLLSIANSNIFLFISSFFVPL